MKQIVLAALLAGCARTLPPPAGALAAAGLARVYKVDGQLYRSPQPDGDQMRELARRYGIKTVIKLNSAWEGPEPAVDGVEVIEDPIAVLAPNLNRIKQAVDDVDAALLNGPVLVHCTRGEDRTGLVVALWELRHKPLLTPALAWNQMVAFGFHDGKFNTPGLSELVEAYSTLTGWRP